MQIPKKLHFIWVGNDDLMPRDCIRSWEERHADWEIRLWGNKELEENQWINTEHIDQLRTLKKWAAVADLMRYEILYEHGGVYVDADSFCLRPLDDWLLESEAFACWVRFLARDRLVNNAFLGSIPKNDFLRFVIEEAYFKPSITGRWSWRRMRRVRMGSWRSVGPHHLTACAQRFQGHGYQNLTILPSHMFSPNHFRGGSYTGKGVVYADHLWASTRKLYGETPPRASI